MTESLVHPRSANYPKTSPICVESGVLASPQDPQARQFFLTLDFIKAVITMNGLEETGVTGGHYIKTYFERRLISPLSHQRASHHQLDPNARHKLGGCSTRQHWMSHVDIGYSREVHRSRVDHLTCVEERNARRT